MISVANGRSFDIRQVLSRSSVSDLPGAEKIMRDCLSRSVEVRYGMVDGKVACVWGLIPPSLLSSAAYIWLLTTDIAAEHKFLFVRHSQRYVEEALKTYPTIIGETVVGNDSAIKWLKWLGAEFGKPNGRLIPFIIKAKHG